MDLDVGVRTQLAATLLAELGAAVPGSDSLLRGSLAAGRSDRYSDIDLLWDVPDARFAQAISALPAILARIRPVASLRFDPDFQLSPKRRLVFIRFTAIPLFWRVDLDVFARSVARDAQYDRDNPAARGTAWSASESSLATVVAAVKAHARGHLGEASRLLERAELRLEFPVAEATLRPRMLRLVSAAADQDPSLAPFAAEVRRLVEELI